MKWLPQQVELLSAGGAVRGSRVPWQVIMERQCTFRRSPRSLISAGTVALSGAALALLSACSKPTANAVLDQPPEVLVMEVAQQDVPVVRAWICSLYGSVNADIRARDSGLLISHNYTDGALV